MPTLKYDFAVVGLQNVLRSLATIEQRFIQSASRIEAAVGRTHERTTGQRIGGGARPGQLGPANDNSRQRVRDEEQAARRVAQTRDSLERQRSREWDRSFKAEQRDRERAVRAEQRARENADRNIARTRSSLERQRSREWDSQFKREQREQEHAEKRQQRHAESMARKAQAESAAQSRWARSTIGTSATRALGTVASVGKMAIGALGLGGGMMVASALQEGMATEKNAALLANQAFGTQAGGNRSRQQLQSQIMAVAGPLGTRTGLGAGSIVNMMAGYHGIAGDINSAMSLAPFLAQMSLATGATMEDLGQVAGRSAMALDVKGVTGADKDKQIKDILLRMVGQGKVGSIEMKNLAGLAGPLLAQASRFEGSTPELAGSLGAVAQIAAGTGADSPEEAMTAMSRFVDALGEIPSKKKLKGLGIDPYKRGKNGVAGAMRDPLSILTELLEKTKGDSEKLGEVFDVRAARAARPLADLYRRGGASGMRAEISKYTDAKASETEMAVSAGAVMGTTSQQFDQLSTQFKDQAKDALLPVLKELAPQFKALMPEVAKLAKALGDLAMWVAKNPLAGLGSMIGLAFTKELATAGLSKIIANWVKGGAGPGGLPVPPVVPGGAAPNTIVPGAAATGGGAFATMTSAPVVAAAATQLGGAVGGFGYGSSLASGFGANSKTTQEAGMTMGYLGAVVPMAGAAMGLSSWIMNKQSGSDRGLIDSFTKGAEDVNSPQAAVRKAMMRTDYNLGIQKASAAQGAAVDAARGQGQLPVPDFTQINSAGEGLSKAAQALQDAAVALGNTNPAGGPQRGPSPTTPR